MDVSRRDFLLKASITTGICAVAAAFSWIFGSVWMAPRRFSGAGWVQVSPVDVFLPGTVTPFLEYRVAIIRTASRIGAISMECTHLGCLVNVVDRGFFCPCHSTHFGPMGEVYSGPADKSLPWHEVAEQEGRLWVYLGKKVAEPHWLNVTSAGDNRGKI
jgi:cytochrome b6-f complex iron-sulfur subunit